MERERKRFYSTGCAQPPPAIPFLSFHPYPASPNFTSPSRSLIFSLSLSLAPPVPPESAFLCLLNYLRLLSLSTSPSLSSSSPAIVLLFREATRIFRPEAEVARGNCVAGAEARRVSDRDGIVLPLLSLSLSLSRSLAPLHSLCLVRPGEEQKKECERERGQKNEEAAREK